MDGKPILLLGSASKSGSKNKILKYYTI